MTRERFAKVIALVFALWTLFEVFDYVRYGFYIQYYKIFRIIAFAVIAYATYKDRRNITIVQGYSILLAVRVCYFFLVMEAQYCVETASGEHISLLAMLPALIEIVAGILAVVITLMAFTEYLSKYKKLAKKIWILPSVLIIMTVVVAQLVHSLFAGAWCNASSYISVEKIILRLIYAGLYFVGMMYVANPKGLQKE